MASTGIDRQRSAYRRGLVLGFTLAEIITLIIFCLLLALTARLLQERRIAETLRQENAAQLVELSLMREKLQQFAASKTPLDDLFRELVLLREKAAELDRLKAEAAALAEKARQWERVEQALAGRLPPGASAEAIARQLALDARLGAALRAALREAGFPHPTPEQLDAVAAAIEEALGSTLADADGLPPAEAVRAALAGRTALATENATLKRQLGNLEEALRRVGPGTEMPPCWRDEKTGRPEYIFDVALTPSGMIVRDRALPHRAAEQAQLPIAMTFLRAVPWQQFLEEALPLFQWSVENKCRFFVRAFDLTAPNEKTEYKAMMRRLEMRFYKLELLDERF